MNCTPNTYHNYKIGVPGNFNYLEILNSDKDIYGGSNCVNPKVIQSSEEQWKNEKNVIFLNIPPLGITILKAKKKVKPRTKQLKITPIVK